jgi:hypothetical protein
MNIDLTQHVIWKGGDWFKQEANFKPTLLRLDGPDDGLSLVGPARVRVAVQAHNQFTLLGTSTLVAQARDVFGYVLDIPPGQTWTYPAPAALSTGTSVPAASNALSSRLGTNAGFVVIIRPAGPDFCADPCAPVSCEPVDPCAPKKDCGCGGSCGCEGHGDDLPCDLAVASRTNLGSFFPAACEPCAPGASVGMPAVKGPRLIVPPARGGTVRTRYFDGMFITKEDLATDQNNNRLKHALMNRAMGQGVVWGFNVGLDGDAVCVLPGYGVDCCGNDVVIASAYRVEADALVRDPAAAKLLARGGAHRMNLLLEYFECPEQPRPVHGDPCSPETTRCETSRIRETARLRLIPPCEIDDSGPIKDLLAVLTRPSALTPAPGPAALAVPRVPFIVQVESLTPAGTTAATADLQPKLTTSPPPTTVEADVEGPTVPHPFIDRTRITVRFPGCELITAQVVKVPGGPIAVETSGGPFFRWTTPLAQAGSELVYRIENWRFRDSAGVEYSAPATTIHVETRSLPGGAVFHLMLHAKVEPSAVSTGGQLPFPCAAEACDPEGRPRFPRPVPWLHDDPGHPGQAADPKVLLLAIVWGILKALGITSPAAQAAFNQLAWQQFYGNKPFDPTFDAAAAFTKLLVDWCRTLLYPGPACECGCEPHGVVIGCATVEGGTVQMVDPWGGRRWVVHYPLLSYWGKQFGVMPLDALASKFFDLLCCIAHYTGGSDVTGGTSTPAGPTILRGQAPDLAVPVGDGVLFVAPASEVPGRVHALGVAEGRSLTVTPLEFSARVIALFSVAAGERAGMPLVHYAVLGVPELNLVAPAPVASSAATPASSGPPSPAAPGRVVQTIRAAVASRAQRNAVPPLLREAAVSVTRGILDAVAPEPMSDAGRAAREALAHSGVTTVAGLLDADPEELHVARLGRAHAAGLAELLEVGEKGVAAAVKAVGDTLLNFAIDGRVLVRDDLARPETAREIGAALSEALKGSLTPEAAAEAVARAARTS